MERESSPWRSLARRSVAQLAERSRQVRDLEDALLEMKKHIDKVEKDRDSIAESAQKVIQGHEERLDRIKAQAERWYGGSIGAMPAIAGILAEFKGFTLLASRPWERWQAMRIAELEAQLREARREAGHEF